MNILGASFITSNTDFRKCPEPTLAEYAFIGRSNVGKSSLINALTNRKELAKTSARPGKTQLINHFLIESTLGNWYLVDLPGYGYARASKSARREFSGIIRNYLTGRRNLVCTLLLIDSRHDPQQIDVNFMEWLAENNLPFVLIFTKCDKLSRTQLELQIKKYVSGLTEWFEEIPDYFVTSSESGQGLEEVKNYIGENLAYALTSHS
jgi:GTP-binding protein